MQRPATIPISTAAGDQKRPAVCALGDGALIAWEDPRNSSTGRRDLYAAVVGPSLTVTPALGLPLAVDSIADKSDIELVAFDQGALAVWELRDDPILPDGIYGKRFSTDGALIDANPILLQEGVAREPAIAGTGSSALLVFEGRDRMVSTRFLSWENELTVGEELQLGAYGDSNPEPAIAWDGQQFLVAWGYSLDSSRSRLTFRRCSPDGQALDAQAFAVGDINQVARSLELSSPSAGKFIVFTADRDENYDRVLYTRSLNFGDTISFGDRERFDTGDLNQPQDPAISSGGPPQLVAWEDQIYSFDPEHGEEIFARRLFESPLNTAPPALLSTATTQYPQIDDVAITSGELGSMAIALVASGGEIPTGLFIGESSNSHLVPFGPIVGRPSAAGRNIAWVAHSGRNNARIVSASYGLYPLSAGFRDLALEAITINGLVALGIASNYDGGHDIWVETPTSLAAPPVQLTARLIGELLSQPDDVQSVMVGEHFYFVAYYNNNGIAASTATLARFCPNSEREADTLEKFDVTFSGNSVDRPKLVVRGESAELIWYDSLRRAWQFLNWPSHANSPSTAVENFNLPPTAQFTAGEVRQHPVALWEESRYLPSLSPPRQVQFAVWQEVDPAGQLVIPPHSTPIQGRFASRPHPTTIGFQQPLSSLPPHLTYFRPNYEQQDFQQPIIEQARLAPLDIRSIPRSREGDYRLSFTATAGADIRIESSADLSEWTFERYVRPPSNTLFFDPRQGDIMDRIFFRARYEIP